MEFVHSCSWFYWPPRRGITSSDLKADMFHGWVEFADKLHSAFHEKLLHGVSVSMWWFQWYQFALHGRLGAIPQNVQLHSQGEEFTLKYCSKEWVIREKCRWEAHNFKEGHLMLYPKILQLTFKHEQGGISKSNLADTHKSEPVQSKYVRLLSVSCLRLDITTGYKFSF